MFEPQEGEPSAEAQRPQQHEQQQHQQQPRIDPATLWNQAQLAYALMMSQQHQQQPRIDPATLWNQAQLAYTLMMSQQQQQQQQQARRTQEARGVVREREEAASEPEPAHKRLFNMYCEGMNYACVSCHGRYRRKQMSVPRDANVVALVRRTLAPHMPEVETEECLLCASCSSSFREGRMPRKCVANGLALDEVPPQLQDLTPVEVSLISLVNTHQTIVILDHGQRAGRGMAISFPNNVPEIAQELPRHADDTGMVVVRLPGRHTDGEVPRRPPKAFTAHCDKVMEALRWLKENNPLYRNVDIRAANVQEEEEDRLGEEDPFAEMTAQDLQHSVIVNADPQLPQINHNDDSNGTGRAFNRNRCTDVPLSFHGCREMEALANPELFPKGTNHMGTSRRVKLSNMQYLRQRVLNKDLRFSKKTTYLANSVSMAHFDQLCSGATIAARWAGGRRVAAPRGLPKTWAFMKALRGTDAYWRSAASHLFAMIKSLGSPTWFVTLSADDYGWEDLATALAGRSFDTDAERSEWFATEGRAELRGLVHDRPVDVARHFGRRFDIFLKYLKDEEVLGQIDDYYWRVEFQRRGSPHIHMLLWINGAPNLDTQEGQDSAPAFIDRYSSATIPPPSDDPIKEDLRALVLRLQQHTCTHTCRKKRANKLSF
jgi:hypothetical protein